LNYSLKKGENAMPQNQLVQARVDGEIKAQATAALADMGLTISDAVRILLTRIAREKKMPLELLTSNTTTIAAMEEARTGNLPRVHSIKALFKELNADD
jgi:DNA-damage-inducible protein J